MSWTVIWTTRTRGQLRVGTEMSCRWQRFKEMVWFMSYTLKTSTFQGNRIFCNSGNTVCLYLVVCYSDWPTVSRQTTFKSWCVREAELLIVYLNYHMWLPCWKSQKLTSSYTIYIENTWLFKKVSIQKEKYRWKMRATRFYTVESRCQIVTDLADLVKPYPKQVVEKTRKPLNLYPRTIPSNSVLIYIT